MRIHPSTTGIACLALLSGLAIVPIFAAGDAAADRPDDKHSHGSPARLVQLVREATRQFLDVNAATDYTIRTGCVSGPEEGAMGVHHINGPLLRDGLLDVAQPEALMYETSRGRTRLLGVEYIVDATTWLNDHQGVPPVLEGQHFHFVDSPNRYGLPPFFELHVWAWRDNPRGAFVDWNTQVSCEGQQADTQER